MHIHTYIHTYIHACMHAYMYLYEVRTLRTFTCQYIDAGTKISLHRLDFQKILRTANSDWCQQ